MTRRLRTCSAAVGLGMLVVGTGCGGDERPRTARPSIEIVAAKETSVVVQRGQRVAIPVAVVTVPRDGQVRFVALTPDASVLRGERLRIAADQRLEGARLFGCLRPGRIVRATRSTSCAATVTGPGTWTVVIDAAIARRAQLGVAKVSRIFLAGGTRVPDQAGAPTPFRDDAQYELRDTAVSVQVVDRLPAVSVTPGAGTGSVHETPSGG
ncbi:hypothetical protein AB0L40_10910 [Patulibacter sp. NPDC049589]|uniref:hypothetical protein n=1 Tax=Patulibacter sp. NPDC049589 TaxID=3154731 RepID=UPI003416122E